MFPSLPILPVFGSWARQSRCLPHLHFLCFLSTYQIWLASAFFNWGGCEPSVVAVTICPDTCIAYAIMQLCILSVCVIWQELNLAVVGSQVVGLVPLKAMLLSADYFMEKEKLFLLEEDQKIRLVSFTLFTCDIQTCELFFLVWCFYVFDYFNP